MLFIILLIAIFNIAGCYKCGDASETFSAHCSNYPRSEPKQEDIVEYPLWFSADAGTVEKKK
jgi:hypothetical protein